MTRRQIATDTEGLLLGDLKPGARVGDYTIEATLAARGTGVVYRATHLVLPRRVSIKVMPAIASYTRSLGAQLLKEACLLEALDHPGVARVYECGVMPDKRPWVACELVDGPTLADRMSRLMIDDQKMSAIEIAQLIRDVADVLEHVHRRGVVHCNLGAHAIVIGGRRRFAVTLADWSSARTFDSSTPVPMLPKSPTRPHLSPEQRVGGIVDGRSDIYALGVAAFRALYNQFPDAGLHPPMNDIPPMLAALVAQMLSRDVAARPTADKVVAAARFVVQTLESEASDDIETGPMAAIDKLVIDEIEDVPSSGIPTFVAVDATTVPTGRMITSEQESAAAGEIEVFARSSIRDDHP
ncbi:MAG: serine/threonine protein kinase [Deltaproteobacteria bacterium]|nr:serine/threonine protein kinase [Deltaproteobacteria bacterium]